MIIVVLMYYTILYDTILHCTVSPTTLFIYYTRREPELPGAPEDYVVQPHRHCHISKDGSPGQSLHQDLRARNM